ncbi:hypothetical protein MRX96_033448 [Rhipicephalus microplus]
MPKARETIYIIPPTSPAAVATSSTLHAFRRRNSFFRHRHRVSSITIAADLRAGAKRLARHAGVFGADRKASRGKRGVVAVERHDTAKKASPRSSSRVAPIRLAHGQLSPVRTPCAAEAATRPKKLMNTRGALRGEKRFDP